MVDRSKTWWHWPIETMVAAGLVAVWTGLCLAQPVDDAVGHAKVLSSAFRQAARRVSPAVVTIVTQYDQYRQVRRGSELVEELFPLEGSIGSGTIIHSSGVVLTNSHVLEGADRVLVRLATGQELPTYDIRRDPWSDIAILRIKDPPQLEAARLGDSDAMDVGDWVIAIGSPFELEATVSAGIISGKQRGLDKVRRGKLLQTDAAINPGNSGGPLVNLEGEVIGINTAIASSSGGYQGVGFAIPSNNAKWIVQQLVTHGEVRRGYLGVALEVLLPREAAQRQLPVSAGVIITGVQPDSAAQRAGLQVDDVIVEFAGMRVRDIKDLQGAVEQQPVGSKQPIKIIRNATTQNLDIMIQDWPQTNG